MLQDLFLNVGGQNGCARLGLVLLLLSSICIGAIADEIGNEMIYPELASFNPDFIWNTNDPISSPYQSGVMPSPRYQNNQKLLPNELGLELYHPIPVQDHVQEETYDTERIPQSFNLRQYNRVPQLGDQGSCDAGWTFASLGSLLSSILPDIIEPFSQNHLKNRHGFDLGSCDGGNADITTAYLARGSGPVSAYADPYSPNSTESENNLAVTAHLERTLVIPTTDTPGHPAIIDLIKRIIMNEGAVYGAYYDDEQFYNISPTLTTYYNPNPIVRNQTETLFETNEIGMNKTELFPNGTGKYQGMLIVGWDDSIKRTDFAVTPHSNGAFLVQNSYGKQWGTDGYFYLSYYDVAFNQMSPVSFTASSVIDYDNVYQYDPFGYTQSYGASESYAFANVFYAERDEIISEVGFYCTNPNAYYTIEIYASSDYINLGNATPISVQTGYEGLSGYYTIPLINPVSIQKYDYFAAVIRMTTPGRWYPVAVEIPIEGYSSDANAAQGQSYVSKDGVTWEDFTVLQPRSNVCLKVYTMSNPRNLVIAFPTMTGGYYPLPHDLNRDGLYEDIDGNYLFDYADVEVFSENIDFAMVNQPVYGFDFDRNGVIGPEDVQALFEMVSR